MDQIIGTCGKCGGPVQIPMVWYGIIPPTPQCAFCHSIPENAFGPRLRMLPNSEKPITEVDLAKQEWLRAYKEKLGVPQK